VGHSLGGAAVLVAAQSISSVKAVATIGAPADPAHVAHLFKESATEIEAAGEAKVEIAGRGFTIAKQFLDDIANHSLEDIVGRLGHALLIFHAPRDEIVGIENAGIIFGAAKHPKSFVSLDDADHLLTRKADAAYVAGVLAAWAERYVGGAEEGPTQQAVPEDFDVMVAETGASKFAQRVLAGTHVFAADEPEKLGGTDTGPGPYDFLLAALGTCTSMTLRLYAEHKGWPAEKIAVALRHGRVHAEDCADADEKDCKIEQIEREIEIGGPLDADQRARMLEIADKCPVHRTLTGDLRIATWLKS
jgi:putative redox protein